MSIYRTTLRVRNSFPRTSLYNMEANYQVHPQAVSGSAINLQSLPSDVLVLISSKVGSSSCKDLHSLKVTCRHTLQCSEDGSVLKEVCTKPLPLLRIDWRDNHRQSIFIRRCKENGNPDALYRKGILTFFAYPRGDVVGLEDLKTASHLGHLGAKYLAGMILLSKDNQEEGLEGLQLLRPLRESRMLIRVRNEVFNFMRGMWMSNALIVKKRTPLCQIPGHYSMGQLPVGVWNLLDDEEDEGMCECCRWDFELEIFYAYLNVH